MCRLPRSAYILSVLVLLGFGAVDAAHGAAILLSDGREISAFAEVSGVNEDGEEVSDSDADLGIPFPPFGLWIDVADASASLPGATAHAVATQSSSVTPTLFTAEMLSGVDSSPGGGAATAVASSDFRVGFELTTPHSFVLTGFASAFPPPGGRRGASVSLSFGSYSFPDSDPTLDAAGVLDSGVYDFVALTGASVLEDIGEGGFSAGAELVFEFALTELPQVPEPSAVLLLVAAVAGAAWSGRRKVRSRGA